MLKVKTVWISIWKLYSDAYGDFQLQNYGKTDMLTIVQLLAENIVLKAKQHPQSFQNFEKYNSQVLGLVGSDKVS